MAFNPVQRTRPIGAACLTYQGRLTTSGAPATGSYDLQFLLYDASSGGAQVGPLLQRINVAVASGLFTVSLDFGAGAFAGSARSAVDGQHDHTLSDGRRLNLRVAVPLPTKEAQPGIVQAALETYAHLRRATIVRHFGDLERRLT